MEPLVIYHASCADGFGAAFSAWTKLGDEAEYLPLAYGTATEKWWEEQTADHYVGREVYILDFSLPKHMMETLFDVAKRVVWLDHHKTAFEMWVGDYKRAAFYKNEDDKHYFILDDNKSGAYLAWEYFHPGEEVPMLIRHIDDYDRWQFKLEGTKEFIKALWSYAPWSFEQWNTQIMDQTEVQTADGLEGRDRFIAQGAAILRAHNQNVQSVVKGAARKCKLTLPQVTQLSENEFLMAGISGPDGLVANCPPHLTSDVGNELANQSGTFGLLWCLSKEGLTAKCSLRSNGDYDVSAIAKAFGGGGHKNAAGFEVPISTLLGWLK